MKDTMERIMIVGAFTLAGLLIWPGFKLLSDTTNINRWFPGLTLLFISLCLDAWALQEFRHKITKKQG